MAEPTLTIRVDPTPNPNAIKLTVNRVVATKGETYRGDPAAAAAPWAKAILSVPGVIGVFGLNTFITVNKPAEADWQTLVPQFEAALKQALS
mgnify:FL=1